MRAQHRSPKNLPLLALSGLLAAAPACTGSSGTDGGGGSPDGGTTQCASTFPAAAVACTAAECSSTTGTKSFGESTLESTAGKSWLVVTWATSEVAGENDNTAVDYTKATPGGLEASHGATARTREESRRLAETRARSFLGEATYASVFSANRVARVASEAAIHAMQDRGPVDASKLRGTAIRPGKILKQAGCSAVAPSCGSTALCVIDEGQTDGACATTLSLKFRTDNTSYDTVSATVRKVGALGAIVVDDDDNAAVSDDDVTELLKRFDEHIAPLDHQFFGEPKDAQGKDRDQNGVVMLFLTSRVASRGAGLVGYFQSDDLLPTAQKDYSNAADLLYMMPPSQTISLEALSGTIGHEYQHLINYYQKKIIRNAGPEDVWLDEGIATFAEDMLGYGGDAFDNDAAYLAMVDQTSLTGAGFLDTTDTNQRRGMAHLLVRYLFEQAGGAAWGSGPADVTDNGGVAAVKKLVQSADTGTLLFTPAATGRSFNAWVGDLLTTLSVSGAGYADVSCNAKYSLRAPATDGYTHNQRGIDVRGSYKNASGQTVALHGPNTATLEMENVPLPTNGGEVRTIDVPSGSVKIGVSGSVDYEVGFRPIPTAK